MFRKSVPGNLERFAILFPAGSRQLIQPNWETLGSDLTMRTDADLDGVWEASESIANVATSIEGNVDSSSQLPSDFKLHQNYPNPFNPATRIVYELPASAEVSLQIFDVAGREIDELVSGYQAAGRYEVEWDGSALSSGLYFYRLQAGGFTQIRRMVLLK